MTRRTPSMPVPRDISAPGRRARGGLGLLTATALVALAGCQNRQNQVIPNRVLDRPLDVALTCVRRDGDELRPVSLDQCGGAVADSVCGEVRLIGFVANSERNDIAMFSRCAGAVIDMNIGAPGPQLISAGEVPSSMTATTGSQASCFAVSANLGSCDLSVLDVGGLAAYAFDEPPEEDPAAYVASVVPTRADGTPLGARPGQVLAVPPELSNSSGLTQSCDPSNPGSVYVTFPSCQLIAEVDLRTQRILQSRQFERDENGVITVIDTGADPACPIDCADQFSGHEEALADAPVGDPDGMYPLAMALVTPPADLTGCVDEADKKIEVPSLYVGGLGSDSIFELRYDDRTWLDEPLELELPQAQGVSAIRPTPALQKVNISNVPESFLFLYVIAGDGSTRVIKRDLDNEAELGIECDTQVDPSANVETECEPASYPGETPPFRRPFARGPGIRAPNGAVITDWAFQKWYAPEAVAAAQGDYDRCPSASSDNPQEFDPNQPIVSPFQGPGAYGTIYGVGTTSFGRLVFSVFERYSKTFDVSTTFDNVGILHAQVPWHSLWPSIDPTQEAIEIDGLPRMDDKAPLRSISDKDVDPVNATRILAPTLRRIDDAYEFDDRVACASDKDCDDDLKCNLIEGTKSGYCGDTGLALVPAIHPSNQDRLARAEDDDVGARGLYEQDVVRAVVRDYAAWETATWEVRWEGAIPGTDSDNGQIVCENPGWPAPQEKGATCLSVEPGDARLVDQTAEFCDRGVLAGDKLFILGCSQPSDCGVGQTCVVDALAPPGSSGLCLSDAADHEKVVEMCRPFFRNDCGAARREFAITRARPQELWLQALDRPAESYLMMQPANLTPGAQLDDDERSALCSGQRLFSPRQNKDDPRYDPAYEATCDRIEDNPDCGTGGAKPCCAPGDYEFTGGPGFVECEERLSCAPADLQPDDGCVTHADCNPEFPLCMGGVCKRVCGPDEDCALTPLPGPGCFQELVRYQVRARNSFVVLGQGPYTFLSQKVKADPETGDCEEDPAVSNLLTSRIRLGRDEEDTRYNTLWPIPSCPTTGSRPSGADPNPCFIDNTPRPSELTRNVAALYHTFSYGDEGPLTVPAIRYSNPMMSFVLDLTSLLDLAKPIPGSEFGRWPGEFAKFRRSRLQGNYREQFGTRRGYTPHDAVVVTSSVNLVGPTRIINAPELSTVFVVDSSGGAAGRGTRGQVVRVTLAGGQVSPDVRFLVR